MASCDESIHENDEMSEEEIETSIFGKSTKKKDNGGAGGSGSKSSKKVRSWVWDHFTKLSNDVNHCNCNYCGKELACSTKSGTSTLKKHLLNICKAYQVWKAANVQNTQTVLTHGGPSGCMTISKVSKSVWKEATNEMVVLAELPLSFVDCFAWRHFCSKVQMYKPHSRRTTTREIVEVYYSKKAAMKKIIENNKQMLSLTTDIWVCPNTAASYMVVTAHFVDVMWQLRKMIIGLKHVCDHKG